MDNYTRFRPGYPPALVDALRRKCALRSDSILADVGAGTGLLTRLFLEHGNAVFAVEPNAEMRNEAKRLLRQYPGFHSVAGCAEACLLADRSVEFVVVGQAFHWFDRRRTRTEFARILKPGGWAVLVWNQLQFGSTPFLRAYRDFLRRYASSEPIDHAERDRAAAADLFGSAGFQTCAFHHSQRLDAAGVCGHVLSLSHMPEPGDAGHDTMLRTLHEILRVHEVGVGVEFPYIATMYYGILA